MDSVKIYDQVNREDETLSFRISKMEDTYAIQNGKVDTPHRHNFYTILITEKAKGKHFIDFNEYALGVNNIFFISPGQVHQLIEDIPSEGFSMLFSNQFLIQNNIPIRFIEDLNLFNDFGESPPLVLNEAEMSKIKRYVIEIFELYQTASSFKYEAIGALLKLTLIACNNSCSIPQADLTSADHKGSTLGKFKNLINEHYKELHATGDYATRLNITPDYLNRIVKSQTGKTAKEHIQSRITVAAKRLLYFTDLSNKEIGFELGFSEPANFSAFFKKCTGTSPSEFKTKH